MSLLAYSPLAGGILAGKYEGGAQPAGTRYTLFESVGARFRKALVREAASAFVALARRRGISPVTLALGYVRSRWFVGATLIGATTQAQLEENLATASVDLDSETLADVAALLQRYPNPAA